MNKNVQSVYNFNAGPSALPAPALKRAQEELTNFRGTGMSVMELSHRSASYEEVHNEAITRLKRLLSISDDYEVLFLQGGASLQFSMIPMNFLTADKKSAYIMTGSWAKKAYAEAGLFGEAYYAANMEENNYARVPNFDELTYNENDAYIHLTTNETIGGVQWKDFPDTGDVPLIADMSSDILSKPIDVNKFGLIYAGAQKNLGPSGVTVVIIRKDLIEKANTAVPTMLKYSTHADANSLFNTPPTFGIYMVGEVLRWIEDLGGLDVLTKQNETKAQLIYKTIDQSNGFYTGHAELGSRSFMNITFRLANDALEKKFLDEAKQAGFVGLNGHRSVGGCRASAYNSVPVEACEALSQFMIQFQQNNS